MNDMTPTPVLADAEELRLLDALVKHENAAAAAAMEHQGQLKDALNSILRKGLITQNDIRGLSDAEKAEIARLLFVANPQEYAKSAANTLIQKIGTPHFYRAEQAIDVDHDLADHRSALLESAEAHASHLRAFEEASIDFQAIRPADEVAARMAQHRTMLANAEAEISKLAEQPHAAPAFPFRGQVGHAPVSGFTAEQVKAVRTPLLQRLGARVTPIIADVKGLGSKASLARLVPARASINPDAVAAYTNAHTPEPAVELVAPAAHIPEAIVVTAEQQANHAAAQAAARKAKMEGKIDAHYAAQKAAKKAPEIAEIVEAAAPETRTARPAGRIRSLLSRTRERIEAQFNAPLTDFGPSTRDKHRPAVLNLGDAEEELALEGTFYPPSLTGEPVIVHARAGDTIHEAPEVSLTERVAEEGEKLAETVVKDARGFTPKTLLAAGAGAAAVGAVSWAAYEMARSKEQELAPIPVR